MKMTVLPIIVWALEMIAENLENRQGKLDIRRIEIMLTKTLLRSARIIGRVLEIWRHPDCIGIPPVKTKCKNLVKNNSEETTAHLKSGYSVPLPNENIIISATFSSSVYRQIVPLISQLLLMFWWPAFIDSSHSRVYIKISFYWL